MKKGLPTRSTPDSVVQARGLTLGFGKRRVLSDVDLDIRRGETWFVLGPNGEGKSTLLNAILGLARPQAGRLQVDELRTRIGYVPQRCDSSRSLPTTVREFISLGLVGSGVPRREHAGRVRESLAETDMLDCLHRDYWQLSVGQRQRILLARALVRAPRLLLLDEPTNGLDLAAQGRLLQWLRQQSSHGDLTTIFVCHDLRLAASNATHVAMVSGGRVTGGPAQEILDETNLARAYRLDPADARRLVNTLSTRTDDRSPE